MYMFRVVYRRMVDRSGSQGCLLDDMPFSLFLLIDTIIADLRKTGRRLAYCSAAGMQGLPAAD